MAEIKHAIQITAKPETVYPLVATARGFGQWWAADTTESAAAVELGFFNRATVYRLKLKIDKAPVHADWICETGAEWSGTHIVFRLEASGAGTLVRFTAWRLAIRDGLLRLLQHHMGRTDFPAEVGRRR